MLMLVAGSQLSGRILGVRVRIGEVGEAGCCCGMSGCCLVHYVVWCRCGCVMCECSGCILVR